MDSKTIGHDRVGKLERIIDKLGENAHIAILGSFILIGLGFGAYSMFGTYHKEKTAQEKESTERERIKAGYQLYIDNANKNNIPDKFYLIDGKKAVIELDGKPILDINTEY